MRVQGPWAHAFRSVFMRVREGQESARVKVSGYSWNGRREKGAVSHRPGRMRGPVVGGEGEGGEEGLIDIIDYLALTSTFRSNNRRRGRGHCVERTNAH